jgi:hypothetical protein
MTEYDIHKVAELTGLAMSSIRRLHAIHGIGYHKGEERALTFTSFDLAHVFRVSEKARLWRAAKRSGYVR